MLYLSQRFARVMPITHPECGQCAGLRRSGERHSPELEALPSTTCRVDGVRSAARLSGCKDRSARAEAGNRTPVADQEVKPFFPYVHLSKRAALDRSP